MNKAENPPDKVWDVIIIGGGPAGLSAALTLLRSCRSVLIIDSGEPRNIKSAHMHGFLSREGTPPLKFLGLCREELKKFDRSKFLCSEVTACYKQGDKFLVLTPSGEGFTSQTVLLATGIKDILPDIADIEDFYGTSIHHCPYCDGWEHRDRRIGVYGDTHEAADLAWELTGWSDDVILILRDKATLEGSCLKKLKDAGITMVENKPAKVAGSDGILSTLVFADNTALAIDALFVITDEKPRSALAESLGCDMDSCKLVVDDDHSTSLKGVFAAGNSCKGRDMVVIAAAQGTMAAISINEFLLESTAASPM